jgi:hypothetical protein
MSDSDGRVSELTIGGRSIDFCSTNGTALTGGFCIRDNTPFDEGGLPITPGVNPNLLNEGFARFDGNPGDVIGEPGSGSYWKRRYDGAPNPIPTIETIGVPPDANNVARISVDESPNQPPNEGHYGAIYYDYVFGDYTSHEHEMYYLVFEVKTGCGWRTDADEPYTYQDGGEFNKYKFRPPDMVKITSYNS